MNRILRVPALAACFTAPRLLWIFGPQGELRRIDLQRAKVQRSRLVLEQIREPTCMAAHVSLVVCEPNAVWRVDKPLEGMSAPIELPYQDTTSAAFSPNGQWLALASTTSLRVISTADWQEAWQYIFPIETPTNRVQFHRDNSRLTVNAGDAVTCFAVNGEVAFRVKLGVAIQNYATNSELSHFALLDQHGELFFAEPHEADFIIGPCVIPGPVIDLAVLADHGMVVATKDGTITQVEPQLRPLHREVNHFAHNLQCLGTHVLSLWNDGALRLMQVGATQ